MKVLITGGAGFIGSNLARELVKEHEVIVLDNFHTGKLDNLASIIDNIGLVECSCNSINTFSHDPLLKDIDIIYHLGIPSSSPMYKNSPGLVGNAINGMIQILEFAKANDIGKVVLASSSSLYNGCDIPSSEDMDIKVTDFYTEARLCTERIAELYSSMFGIKSICLRLFSVYGPNEDSKGTYANMVSQFMWSMRDNKSPIVYGDGSQARDFVFVGDVVNAFRIAMELNVKHDIINVGTGIMYSFNHVIKILNAKMNIDIEPTYIEMPITNYVRKTLADTSKLDELGYKYKYSLEQGIDMML